MCKIHVPCFPFSTGIQSTNSITLNFINLVVNEFGRLHCIREDFSEEALDKELQ